MNRFEPTIKRYISFILWLIPDSLLRSKWLGATILTTGFLGVAFQVQVFGLIIYYARYFSSGELIMVADYSVDPRTSAILLGIGSLAVIFLLLASALCIYYSRQGILRLGREYEEFCGKRVFHLLGRHNYFFDSAEEGAGGDIYLLRLIKSDSRFAGQVMRMLFSLFIPGLTLVVAIFVLLYLEPLLTVGIAFFSFIFTYHQYLTSRAAARHSVQFEKLGPAVGRAYKGLLQHFKQQAHHGESHALVEQVYANGPVKMQLDAYEGRLRSVENSRLISGIFMAIVLGLIMLIMGTSIIREGSGWGRLLIYLVALRFAMANLQNAFSTITVINRCYPQVRRYSLFVQSFPGQDQNQDRPPILDEYMLRVVPDNSGELLPGTSRRLKVRTGTRLALITPLDLNRYTIASLARVMLNEEESIFKGALHSMRLATRGHSCPRTSLREVLGLGPKADWHDFKALFPQGGWWENAREQLPNNLDNKIEPKLWDRIEPKLKFVLSLLSAARADCRWVLVESRGVSLLDQGATRFYLDLLKDRITVVVFNSGLSRVGAYGEESVAVGGVNGILGLGSPEWFARVRAEVENLLELKGSKKEPAASDENSDELDIECY